MSKLEKVKEFYEEHKDGVTLAVSVAAASIVSAMIYRAGYKHAVKNGGIGINALILAKPELKPMLEEALQKVKETMK